MPSDARMILWRSSREVTVRIERGERVVVVALARHVVDVDEAALALPEPEEQEGGRWAGVFHACTT